MRFKNPNNNNTNKWWTREEIIEWIIIWVWNTEATVVNAFRHAAVDQSNSYGGTTDWTESDIITRAFVVRLLNCTFCVLRFVILFRSI